MGIDFRLACDRCKEYIDLHKWCPHENAVYDQNKCEGYERYSACVTNAHHIYHSIECQRIELLVKWPDHWVGEIIPYVEKFCAIHKEHRLLIFSDASEMPWYPDEPGWYQWKEIGTPVVPFSSKEMNVELPRNIIDDLRILDWKSAKQHYLENCPFVDNPDELEAIFADYLRLAKVT